jgi:hypothetical protein
MNPNTLFPLASSPNRAISSASRAQGRNTAANGQKNEDVNQRFKDRFTNLHSKSQIQKEREFDESKAKLMESFKDVDLDRNGLISQEELYEALCRKAPGGHFDIEVSNSIFAAMDRNADGNVTIEEFTERYLD